MGIARDTRDQQRAIGSTGSITNAQTQLALQAYAQRRNRDSLIGAPINVLDPATDHVWAQGRNATKAPHNYFDYYFTGQDIKVYVDGADSTVHADMPVIQLAFNVQQQKTPLYGFASYTYDAMMRGNRIISGVLRISTRDVHYMTNLLQEAAAARANQHDGLYELRGLTTDEELIETYWTQNIDPEIRYNNNKHLWSSHPPFNLVIVYGLQSTSLRNALDSRVEEVYSEYNDLTTDNTLYSDINERLVESDVVNYSQRRVLESVELTGLQVEYGPDGQVCSEVYSFLARDMKLTNT